MHDFWPDCAWKAADRQADGSLAISDDFLRSLWLRPEVAPVPESCKRERELHQALLAAPRDLPGARDMQKIADPDAQENYVLLSAFVARLLQAPSAEAAYRDIFAGEQVQVAPLFIDLLAQLILRDVLADCDDPFTLRAAELLFRPQKVTIQEGAVLLADAEVISRHASGDSFGALGKLLVEARIKPRNIPLDVLHEDNAAGWAGRSGRHDMVLPFQFGSAGLAGFCRVLERWLERMMSLSTTIKPVKAIEQQQWGWHIGLDAQATAIMNSLWRQEKVDNATRRRLLALFEMRLPDKVDVVPGMEGQPVHLACAMASDDSLRVKPQNLLLNLPLA